MQLVGAGLCLSAHNSGARNAKFGVVVRCCDLGFGDRFQRRVDHDPSQHRVVIVGAVQQVGGAGETLPVDEHSVRTLRVLRRRSSQGSGEADNARRHQLKIRESAVEHR